MNTRPCQRAIRTRPNLTLKERCQRLETLARFRGLWAIRVPLSQLAPGSAIVMKPLGRTIENKLYSLTIVPIEAIKIHEVSKLRCAVRRDLLFIKPTRSLVR